MAEPRRARPWPAGHRRPLGFAALVVLVVVVATASLALGARSVPIGRVLDAFVAFDAGLDDHLIVRTVRLPRTLIGLMVGAALGLAGALMQGVTRNPLADPGLLGINAGAALAVVIAISVLGVSSLQGYVWFAFAGAAVAAVVVYALGSRGGGGATPVKLAVAGAALTILFASLAMGVMLRDSETVDQFRFWLAGSLAGRDASVALWVAPFVVLGATVGLFSARSLDGLALGDDVARSLGQRVARQRIRVAVAVVLLCGAATAAVGPIVFVGLTVPHVARAVTGPAHRWLLPYAGVLGAVLLVVADLLARVVARPAELQVGVVTAFLGAPVFIAFVRRRRIAEL